MRKTGKRRKGYKVKKILGDKGKWEIILLGQFMKRDHGFTPMAIIMSALRAFGLPHLALSEGEGLPLCRLRLLSPISKENKTFGLPFFTGMYLILGLLSIG
jgi:hypothetical protein